MERQNTIIPRSPKEAPKFKKKHQQLSHIYTQVHSRSIKPQVHIHHMMRTKLMTKEFFFEKKQKL